MEDKDPRTGFSASFTNQLKLYPPRSMAPARKWPRPNPYSQANNHTMDQGQPPAGAEPLAGLRQVLDNLRQMYAVAMAAEDQKAAPAKSPEPEPARPHAAASLWTAATGGLWDLHIGGLHFFVPETDLHRIPALHDTILPPPCFIPATTASAGCRKRRWPEVPESRPGPQADQVTKQGGGVARGRGFVGIG